MQAVTLASNHTSGVWAGLSDATLADLLLRRIYLNVHSSTATAGELRAMMSYNDGSFLGELTGAAAGTNSTAKGTIWTSFRDDSIQYHATVAGLSSAYASSHFHLSPGGSVIKAAPMIDSTTTGYWVIGQNVYDIIRGKVYFNVHTTNFPQGEIRAMLGLGTGTPTAVPSTPGAVPTEYALAQNFPNPFNPSTTIEFAIARPARVAVHMLNVLGQRVATLADGRYEAGTYRANFDASRMPTGVYFYTLAIDGAPAQTRKMLFLK